MEAAVFLPFSISLPVRATLFTRSLFIKEVQSPQRNSLNFRKKWTCKWNGHKGYEPKACQFTVSGFWDFSTAPNAKTEILPRSWTEALDLQNRSDVQIWLLSSLYILACAERLYQPYSMCILRSIKSRAACQSILSP